MRDKTGLISGSWLRMQEMEHDGSHEITGKNVAATIETVDEDTSGPSRSARKDDIEAEDERFAESQGGRDTTRRSKMPMERKRKSHNHLSYRVYKRRWFGLAQLVLLNIVVSWDWLTFAPVSTTSAEYFNVSESAINWLSTGFLFAFVGISPLTIWILNRSPKDSIIAASVLLLIGNWIRYAGTRASNRPFGVVILGQVLTGLAQPFVLAAPTRYSDLWFTEAGRVSATAIMTLANPFGAAIAQLINPLLGDVPHMVLYVSIIASLATIPSFFIPRSPPTPPSASSAVGRVDLIGSIRQTLQSRSFYFLFIAFSVYVGFFNAFSSLLNQILYPYGYSEDEAGICGAILIVVGLVAAAITSPIFDRTHAYVIGIRILCTLIALAYVAMIWAPQTRGLVAPYMLAAIEGAASFSLLPTALEYLVEVTFPASPEVSSTICWTGGQLFGGLFIVIMDALKDSRPVDLDKVNEAGRGNGGGNRPPGNMIRALVFQGVVCMLVLPFPLMLGVKRLGLAKGEGRLKVDEQSEGTGVTENGVLGEEQEAD